jgi:hypothetical protein
MTLRPALLLGFALAAALAVPACSSPSTPAPERTPPAATGLPAAEIMHLGEEAGIHGMAEIAPGLFRGAQPEGDASFALLARLGVRTILSVDGSRPDVEGAARHGIRTIHVPIEYSGVTRGEQVKIAAAALSAEGGLFVHCHHGKHRGPAASSIAWMTLDGASCEQAVADMKLAGTDPGYEGLYRDVANFRPVTAEELATVTEADLPPTARTPDLVDAMVNIDGGFDRMKAVRKAGWKTPADMPDVSPAHEARILAEHFREMRRLDEAKRRPADFQGWAAGAETAAWDLEKAIQAADADAAAKALDRVAVSCKDCHNSYRNK